MDEQQEHVRQVGVEVSRNNAEWLVAIFLTMLGFSLIAFWQHPNWLFPFAIACFIVKFVFYLLGAFGRWLDRHLDGQS